MTREQIRKYLNKASKIVPSYRSISELKQIVRDVRFLGLHIGYINLYDGQRQLVITKSKKPHRFTSVYFC